MEGPSTSPLFYINVITAKWKLHSYQCSGSTMTWPATWTSTGFRWTSSTARSSLSPLGSPTDRWIWIWHYYFDIYIIYEFDIIFSYIQIQMKWMGADQNNVNSNISLAQFSFNVQLMDSYSTDYYEIAYPGLIMRVCLYIRCFVIPRLHLETV